MLRLLVSAIDQPLNRKPRNSTRLSVDESPLVVSPLPDSSADIHVGTSLADVVRVSLPYVGSVSTVVVL